MAVTEGLTPALPPAELPPMDAAGRADRLRARLGDSGCDALVVTNLTNVRYLTGFTGSAGIVLVTAPDHRAGDGGLSGCSAALAGIMNTSSISNEPSRAPRAPPVWPVLLAPPGRRVKLGHRARPVPPASPAWSTSRRTST